MSEVAASNSTFMHTSANINLLWASLLIEELVRHNICDFCIAPGSRSTPLTLAAASHKAVNTHVHFDERGLGFFALGLSLSSQKPVVVITTSGTAVANLYPAVIEARQSAIPLIILSADRPPELLHCGANQAIDQYAIFSHYPVFFRQIPSPTLQIKPNYLLTTINQGLVKQQNSPAPIHFNVAFAEPLYPQETQLNYQQYLSPLKKWLTNRHPFSHYLQGQKRYEGRSTFSLLGKKVVVIAGRLDKKEQVLQIAEFAKKNHYPLLADIQSSLTGAINNLCYYDLLLLNKTFQRALAEADIIIQFGDKLISTRLAQFIAEFAGDYWLIKKGEQSIDPNLQLTTRFDSDANGWIQSQHLLQPIDEKWLVKLTQYNQKIAQQIIAPFMANTPLCEINLVASLDNLLSNDSPLFIANSMPIRITDMFMKNNLSRVFTNRGASGIDGLLATAVGIAKNARQTTTLLIGDTAFLYDLNSLTLLKQLSHPFIIILINNDGGAIFNLLPVPAQQKQKFYQLPHGLTFAESCKQFAIDYYKPSRLDEFKADYKKALKNRGALIEVCVENNQTSDQLEQLKKQITNATF
ncbi:2-succinyl-5-enolpyruvyl-6-hydroxy-3-cyclohexene-1-carboxylic-acid synthase [Psychromonas antarctica]|uniref:2-succinyl-5-enolpyruvyl-6-hydroxy-3- cyclohexene-1-carboxylic-acid synthase n=1 Tax=Psychromonas antarctica TaxID=67573 RepID=UPI001EE93CFF|nr:2-succinyl-5-enolpyruvyl-6-hydroxy-3-cyclohexene-1-carboxylic-acid synthase [Psychromonas antarctica]MCG6200134.1 2-succinyl-5-enolpyruvyl-6-hydroxy-3-cyclohexene-1-carboxylic-acid synthase [Psychromonas antarctica]